MEETAERGTGQAAAGRGEAPATTLRAQGRTAEDARDAALIASFVNRHFSWRGTARLHRAALGPDLLRAPVNVALAPVALILRLGALALHIGGARRAGDRVAGLRLHLRTDVARGLRAALEREVIAPRGPRPPAPSHARLIDDYLTARGAVAEIAMTLVLLVIGATLFRAATPGFLSLAPVLSDQAAQAAAIAGFPLGAGLGRLWYGVFPVALPGWLIGGIAAALLILASVVTTFAGLLTDPLQAVLGVHRRRLERLIAALDGGGGTRPAIGREHLLARLADLGDVAATVLRMLRP